MYDFIHITAKTRLGTNSFILTENDGTKTIIIDPECEASEYLPYIKGETLLVLTHGHYDHISAVEELRKKDNVRVLMHEADARQFGINADGYLSDGDEISLCGANLTAIHTPGHTPGSICIYDEENGRLISGDTLFYHECGRCDLEGGSFDEMLISLKKLAENVKPDSKVYPGHDRFGVMSDELKHNLYIQQALKR